MSQHHYDEENQEQTETTAMRKRSYSHHTPLNLKPVMVISHIKRRVKQKRDEKAHAMELSDGAPTRKTSEKNNKAFNHNESSVKSSSVRDRSQSYTLPLNLWKRNSFSENSRSNTKDNDDTVFESDQQTPVLQDRANENENMEKSVQWKVAPAPDTPDQSLIKARSNLVKASKSLPETNSQGNVKKRRQTVRRTVRFLSPKNHDRARYGGFQLRDEDFTMIFSDLPADEQLIIAFPCALRKDVYMHGRMFLSVNYFSFYTCFFKWEEKLTIAYKDVISITREKSARLVPNAVKIRTKNQEQHLFVSLVPREKVFLAVFRLWQNALLEQPLDHNQLRTLVYADQQNHDETSGDSEESISLENNGGGISELGPHSTSLPVTSNRRSELSKTSRQAQPPLISLPPSAVSFTSKHGSLELVSEDEIDNIPRSCTCETHRAKTYADTVFTYDVDTLFEYVCGDNAFSRDFHNAQKLTDFTFGEWTVNPESGKRERQVTYKTITHSILGTNTLTCREKQTLVIDRPHVMYVLSVEVYNEGMKYTDTFYVATQFCMVQRDPEHSSLRVSADITYIKSVNSFVKSFIEKNSVIGIENGINEQIRRLEVQQEKPTKRKLTRKSALAAKQSAARTAPDSTSARPTQPDSADNSSTSPKSILSLDRLTMSGSGIFYDVGIVVGVLLILLHIYLCYKFYSVDQVLLTLDTGCYNQCRETCMTSHTHL